MANNEKTPQAVEENKFTSLFLAQIKFALCEVIESLKVDLQEPSGKENSTLFAFSRDVNMQNTWFNPKVDKSKEDVTDKLSQSYSKIFNIYKTTLQASNKLLAEFHVPEFMKQLATDYIINLISWNILEEAPPSKEEQALYLRKKEIGAAIEEFENSLVLTSNTAPKPSIVKDEGYAIDTAMMVTTGILATLCGIATVVCTLLAPAAAPAVAVMGVVAALAYAFMFRCALNNKQGLDEKHIDERKRWKTYEKEVENSYKQTHKSYPGVLFQMPKEALPSEVGKQDKSYNPFYSCMNK